MRTKNTLQWWFVAGLVLLGILMACGQNPAQASAVPTMIPSNDAPVSAAYTVFMASYQRCGGVRGAGEILEGPAWMDTQWVVVTTNMVFAWPADDAAHGVRPLVLNSPSGEDAPEILDPGFFYTKGHNVPTFFEQYIRSRGGWACAGDPVGELQFRENDEHVACQPFAHLTLCYDYQRQQGFIEALGKEFLQKHKNELLERLPTAIQAAPGWQLLVSVEPADTNMLHLIVGGQLNGEPMPSDAVLAIQLQDDIEGTTLYVDMVPVSTLGGGVWTYDFSLNDMHRGTTARTVLRACVVFDKQLMACGESVFQ